MGNTTIDKLKESQVLSEKKEPRVAPTKPKEFSMKTSTRFVSRIEDQIIALQQIKHTAHSKQRFIVDAVREKLKKDPEPTDDVASCYLGYSLDGPLYEKTVERIKKHKAAGDNCSLTSLKNYVLTALDEKLEREEKGTREALKEIISSN